LKGIELIGQTVSHYRIIRQLGVGGMGVVYEAVDINLDRTVALKFLPPDSTSDKKAKARFIHEAKAANALDHQNVCTIHEIGELDDGQLFIAMARYEGESLRRRIKRGAMPATEILNITSQIASGIGRAHEKGIVHRDLKPDNVRLTTDGIAKIVDFGLAVAVGVTRLTRTGSSVGTPAYMSPEQVLDKTVTPGTDIWALGVMIYEMVEGRRPFCWLLWMTGLMYRCPL
jgi:serine/threonine protein kinase